MPLINSASRSAVGPNIKAEEAAKKPYRQALAIALSVQDRARRARADGGVTYGPNLPQGMTSVGNLPIYNRPALQNPDGSYSTADTIGVGSDTGEVIIPRVVDGKRLSNQGAIQNYKTTGGNFGKFSNPDDADAYATTVHNAQQGTYDSQGRPLPMYGRFRGGPLPMRRDDGGAIDPNSGVGGLAPSAQNQNPIVQSLYSQYQGASPEKLQEMAALLGNSPRGQVVQQLLRQQHGMAQPNGQPTPQPQQPPQQQSGFGIANPSALAPAAPPPGQPQQQPAMAFGGGIHKLSGAPPSTPWWNRAEARGMGGSQPTAIRTPNMMGPAGGMQHLALGGSPPSTPWWTRAEAREDGGYGLLHSPLGAAGGRTDSLPHAVAADSFVMPADVVSSLGEGDTFSGGKIMDAMMHSMPGGIEAPSERGDGHGVPGIPRPPAQPESTGGRAHGPGGKIPVLLANGEWLVDPATVARIGGGDVKRGHRVLRKLVLEIRKRSIKELKALPPPVK